MLINNSVIAYIVAAVLGIVSLLFLAISSIGQTSGLQNPNFIVFLLALVGCGVSAVIGRVLAEPPPGHEKMHRRR